MRLWIFFSFDVFVGWLKNNIVENNQSDDYESLSGS